MSITSYIHSAVLTLSIQLQGNFTTQKRTQATQSFDINSDKYLTSKHKTTKNSTHTNKRSLSINTSWLIEKKFIKLISIYRYYTSIVLTNKNIFVSKKNSKIWILNFVSQEIFKGLCISIHIFSFSGSLKRFENF